jgi:hypothetical protein
MKILKLLGLAVLSVIILGLILFAPIWDTKLQDDSDLSFNTTLVSSEDNALYTLGEDLSPIQLEAFITLGKIVRDEATYTDSELQNLITITKPVVDRLVKASQKKNYQCTDLINKLDFEFTDLEMKYLDSCSLSQLSNFAKLTSYHVWYYYNNNNTAEATSLTVSILDLAKLLASQEEFGRGIIDGLVVLAIYNIALEAIDNYDLSELNESQFALPSSFIKNIYKKEYENAKKILDLKYTNKYTNNYWYQENRTKNLLANHTREIVNMDNQICTGPISSDQVKNLSFDIRKIAMSPSELLKRNGKGKFDIYLIFNSLDKPINSFCKLQHRLTSE